METERDTNLTEARPLDGLEVINGVRMALGTMSLKHLQMIEAACQQRAEAAHDDAWIVQSYRERLTPPDGEAA